MKRIARKPHNSELVTSHIIPRAFSIQKKLARAPVSILKTPHRSENSSQRRNKTRESRCTLLTSRRSLRTPPAPAPLLLLLVNMLLGQAFPTAQNSPFCSATASPAPWPHLSTLLHLPPSLRPITCPNYIVCASSSIENFNATHSYYYYRRRRTTTKTTTLSQATSQHLARTASTTTIAVSPFLPDALSRLRSDTRPDTAKYLLSLSPPLIIVPSRVYALVTPDRAWVPRPVPSISGSFTGSMWPWKVAWRDSFIAWALWRVCRRPLPIFSCPICCYTCYQPSSVFVAATKNQSPN